MVDRKIGKEVQDNLLQLFNYTLYLVEQYHIRPKQIEIRTEYLTIGESNNIKVSEEDIWRVKEIIKKVILKWKNT